MGFSLFPKEVKFYDLFKEQNKKLLKAVTILDDIFHSQINQADIDTYCSRINILESEANAISRNIATQLSSTFITPLDREDIHQINITQEALINIIKATATRIDIFECYEMLYPSRRLVRSLKVIIEEVGKVFDKLSRDKKVKKYIDAIKTQRYECETLLMVGLGELFDDEKVKEGKPEAMLYLIKWNHIYGRIEQAVERAERLSDVLEGILLKHA